MMNAIKELKSYKAPGIDDIRSETLEEISYSIVENPDFEAPIGGGYPEGSGNGEFGFIPPPPPPPDGKNCIYDKEDFCNEILSPDNAAGLGYRGEKGDRGPRGPPGESIRGPPGPPGPQGPLGPEVSFKVLE
ncbi:hypothetical protein WA026_020601 [Henosepilachna vigintioctopunctata]|uniref:Uncharacterized protein n=1 Tax=Henosepilachna vigintioctopunctata TaxID=420089 RepID=A0AAW1UWD8_9CUCU